MFLILHQNLEDDQVFARTQFKIKFKVRMFLVQLTTHQQSQSITHSMYGRDFVRIRNLSKNDEYMKWHYLKAVPRYLKKKNYHNLLKSRGTEFPNKDEDLSRAQNQNHVLKQKAHSTTVL